MKISTKCFGAYDIRGVVPSELNEDLAYRIGRFFPALYGARKVVTGHDVRISSPMIQEALIRGLRESGCDVMDIGQCGTEMVYFSTFHYGLDGGIMVTASHNPKEYNGMKFVRENACPLTGDDWKKLTSMVTSGVVCAAKPMGHIEQRDITIEYVEHILSYVDVPRLKPFKVVVNAGNGAVGPVLDAMEICLPFELVKIFHEPNGNFPHGVPNPLLIENRADTAHVVCETCADVGVAWDGDFDRCFFFDEKGNFVDGYFVVGILAQALLKKYPKGKIVHDPRLMWNTVEMVEREGGEPIVCQCGHTFIKRKMRDVNAIYGGEMSAHHYFRDFAYCDSGMIPWLLMMEILSQESIGKMSQLVAIHRARYSISGEINSKVENAQTIISRIESEYGMSGNVTKVDGLSVEYKNWRFNLRQSNTEPVLRLNVEAYQDEKLMQEKTAELLRKIRE